jgi:hypothetical protein
MTDLVILVPMLHRAHRVAPLLDSIHATAPDARVLFLCTRNDTAVLAAVADHEHLVFPPAGRGDYQRKINAGYQATTEPLLFLAADDLRFHPGWKAAAVAKLTDGVGVVGTNDLGSPRVIAGEHATHCLISRDYVDRHGTIDEPGKVLHEGYPHEFCDDELVGTAKHRNAWAFASDAHVEHLHPNWGKAPSDDLYAAQHTRIRVGRRIYQRRRRLWT